MSIYIPNKVLIQDVMYKSYLFQKSVIDSYGDREVFSSAQPSTQSIQIVRHYNDRVQILIDGNALFQGLASDHGDHEVYTASNSFADKGERKDWILDHQGNDIYTLRNCYDGSYLFVGHAAYGGGEKKLWSGKKVSGTSRALFRIASN